MDLKGLAHIKVIHEYTDQSYDSLSLLYYPLIGKDAYALYGVLKGLDGMSLNQGQLIPLTNLSENLFDKARMVLEEFGLIKTYFDAMSRNWLYVVMAPLNPNVFLTHEIYGRLFLNETGSTNYDFMKMRFNTELEVEGKYLNISKSFDENRLRSWSQTKEDSYQQVKPQDSFQKEFDFDFETFLKGMDRIFPIRLQTAENFAKIARLATIHGIDAKDMKKFVQRSVNPNTKEFDYEKLQKAVMYQNKNTKKSNDPYKMAPVQFMASKQNGAPVSIADKKLIESLCQNYPFSNEVVNVLIEYVLKTTNQQFPKAYVEKVASSWARMGVDSKEKALQQTKPQKKESGNHLPDWYNNTGTQEVDDDILKEALEIQKKLRGE